MKFIFFTFIFSLTSFSALADFEFYKGARQMGMGGASIAVVNDETAILSNPNGLGRLRNYFFTVFDPEVTGSSSQTSVHIGTALINSIVPEDVYNQLSDSLGEPYYFKGQVFPSIVLPNFGIGLLGKYEVLAMRNADGTYNYNYQNDYSLNLGYNLSFWGGRIKFGFAGRMINRMEFQGTLDPAVDSLALSAFANEGMGVAVDSGLTLSAPWDYIPTLTVYVRDIGNTSFTMSDGLFQAGGNGPPQSVSQSIDAAVAFFPIYSKSTRGVFTIEYTGLTDSTPVDNSMDRFHIGTEINFLDSYFFRAGYHQNSWTAGFEYSTGIIQWQMSTYSEKITIGTLTDRDRRATIKFAVRF